MVEDQFEEIDKRGQPGLNRRPLDLQSNALPLSYIPYCRDSQLKLLNNAILCNSIMITQCRSIFRVDQ